MAEDAKGDLWLATDGGGVARWDRLTEQFQLFRHDARKPRTLASDAVRTLLIDSQGRIWAGTLDQGLDVLDPSTGDVRHYRHREGEPVPWPPMRCARSMRTTAAGSGSAPTADSAATTPPATTSELSRGAGGDSLSDVRVRAIREDHAGALWIGTYRGGLNRLDPERDG